MKRRRKERMNVGAIKFIVNHKKKLDCILQTMKLSNQDYVKWIEFNKSQAVSFESYSEKNESNLVHLFHDTSYSFFC